MNSDALSHVAQIFNLLYRRIAFCEARLVPTLSKNPNAPKITNLRYSRLQICATTLRFALIA
jgi:hypothetical protein